MEQKDILYNLRKEAGLTLEQLSSKTNLSRNMLWHLEKGSRTGTLDTLKILAEFYAVSLDYITGYDETRELVNKFLADLSKKYDLNDPKVQYKILKAVDEALEED